MCPALGTPTWLLTSASTERREVAALPTAGSIEQQR